MNAVKLVGPLLSSIAHQRLASCGQVPAVVMMETGWGQASQRDLDFIKVYPSSDPSSALGSSHCAAVFNPFSSLAPRKSAAGRVSAFQLFVESPILALFLFINCFSVCTSEKQLPQVPHSPARSRLFDYTLFQLLSHSKPHYFSFKSKRW